MIITTRSEDETAAVGRDFAATLAAGAVVLLSGDLGAGKTAFVRGMAEGLGIPPSEVSSPTFALVQEYSGGRVRLLHVDLYRLNDPREIDDLGLDELGEGAIVAIEWAERLARPIPGAQSVRFEHGEGDVRTISITPIGSSALPS